MTCSAGCCTSTGELHERISVPHGLGRHTTGFGDVTTPVLTMMPPGFDLLIPIALLAAIVAITMWVLLMPAAAIIASYGPQQAPRPCRRQTPGPFIDRAKRSLGAWPHR